MCPCNALSHVLSVPSHFYGFPLRSIRKDSVRDEVHGDETTRDDGHEETYLRREKRRATRHEDLEAAYADEALRKQKRVASYHQATLRRYRRNIAEAINLSCSQDDAVSRRFCSPVRDFKVLRTSRVIRDDPVLEPANWFGKY
ncbi:Uncharacterized protein DBV15_03150 [Temnothorax longispinosus]|uniref:Uncharacterized protein n=1 Tax=Temnothorax longispinosus TaxID=300112 RepID=A0A4S2KNR7_9HYME|nr:Uncharacterized protein DBV15_03150 [Temnothorax longispinosus]